MSWRFKSGRCLISSQNFTNKWKQHFTIFVFPTIRVRTHPMINATIVWATMGIGLATWKLTINTNYISLFNCHMSADEWSNFFSWNQFHENFRENDFMKFDFTNFFWIRHSHTYNKSVDQWWNNDIPSSLTNGTVTILSSSEASPPDDRVPQPDTCIWSPFWNSMPNSGKVTGVALLFQSPQKIYVHTFYYFHIISAFLKLI